MQTVKLTSVLLTYALLCLAECFAADASDSRITYDELKTLSDIQLKLHPDRPPLLDKIVTAYGKHSSYTAQQIEGSSTVVQPAEPVSAEPTSPIRLKPHPTPQGLEVITHAILHPKLRQDYTDVLPGEDPSQQNLAAGKFDDLNGASLSYTWDGKAHTNTWSAEAALITPMVWEGKNLVYGPMPIFYGLVPSVSLNRVETNGVTSTDSLTYRAGVFAQWLLAGSPGQKFHARLNVRGSFTYETDTQNNLRLPAGEFDVEPQMFCGPNWALGYLFNPFVGEQAAIDPNQAHFQVRTWLHGEYGKVDRSSEQVMVAHSTFFRVGPVLQLKFDVPKLPVLNKPLTFNLEYHYVPTLSGPGGHDTLLKTNAEFALMAAEDGEPRVTLKASYTSGGLDLTKQNVETFTLGLGVLF
jgi:hypothetical protein